MSGMNFLGQFLRTSGRARRGMFAGRDKGFGNNVSFSNRKTRRSWKPNAQKKRLYSEILGDMVGFDVTTHALRCIDKAGGLDRYLLKASDKDIGYQGIAIRQKITDILLERKTV